VASRGTSYVSQIAVATPLSSEKLSNSSNGSGQSVPFALGTRRGFLECASNRRGGAVGGGMCFPMRWPTTETSANGSSLARMQSWTDSRSPHAACSRISRWETPSGKLSGNTRTSGDSTQMSARAGEHECGGDDGKHRLIMGAMVRMGDMDSRQSAAPFYSAVVARCVQIIFLALQLHHHRIREGVNARKNTAKHTRKKTRVRWMWRAPRPIVSSELVKNAVLVGRD